MALFERDYDRDYGRDYRWGRPDGRSRWANSGRPLRTGHGGMESDRWASRYGGEYQPYDHSYKTRWETDHGDPFGDRAQRTPMRVIREDRERGYHAYDRDRPHRERNRGYDRGWGMGELNRGYDRDWSTAERYHGHPMGYRNYEERHPDMQGRTFREYGRRYDGGWF